jgi:hypothetical protein
MIEAIRIEELTPAERDRLAGQMLRLREQQRQAYARRMKSPDAVARRRYYMARSLGRLRRDAGRPLSRRQQVALHGDFEAYKRAGFASSAPVIA